MALKFHPTWTLLVAKYAVYKTLFVISLSMYVCIHLGAVKKKPHNYFNYEAYETMILKGSISLEQVINKLGSFLMFCLLNIATAVLWWVLFNNLVSSNRSFIIPWNDSRIRLENCKHSSYLNLCFDIIVSLLHLGGVHYYSFRPKLDSVSLETFLTAYIPLLCNCQICHVLNLEEN